MRTLASEQTVRSSPPLRFELFADVRLAVKGGQTAFLALLDNLAFHPTKNAAVLWANLRPDGSDDSLVLRASNPLIGGEKFGASCTLIVRPPIELLRPAMNTWSREYDFPDGYYGAHLKSE